MHDLGTLQSGLTLTSLVPCTASLMMQSPLLRVSFSGVGLHGSPENIRHLHPRASGRDQGRIYTGHGLLLTHQISGQRAEVHQPGAGCDQAPIPPAQYQHSVSLQRHVCGKRVPEIEDPLVDSHEDQDRRDATCPGLLCYQAGDLILRETRSDRTRGLFQRTAAGPPKDSKSHNLLT